MRAIQETIHARRIAVVCLGYGVNDAAQFAGVFAVFLRKRLERFFHGTQWSNLPGRQFFFRERIEKSVVERYPALPRAKLWLPLALETHKARDRLAVAGNDDFLALLDLSEQARQMGFRLMDVHYGHRRLLFERTVG